MLDRDEVVIGKEYYCVDRECRLLVTRNSTVGSGWYDCHYINDGDTQYRAWLLGLNFDYMKSRTIGVHFSSLEDVGDDVG